MLQSREDGSGRGGTAPGKGSPALEAEDIHGDSVRRSNKCMHATRDTSHFM